MDDSGTPVPGELFGIEAPEGGFADSAELLDAYDAALEEMEESEAFEGADLIAALSLSEDDVGGDEDEIEDDVAESELA